MWEGAQAVAVVIAALDLGAQYRTRPLADLAGNTGHVIVAAEVELAAVAPQHVECCLSSCLGRSIEDLSPRSESRRHESAAAAATSWGDGWLSGRFGDALGSRDLVILSGKGVILDNGRICAPAGIYAVLILDLDNMLLLLLPDHLVVYGGKRVVFRKRRISAPASLDLVLIIVIT